MASSMIHYIVSRLVADKIGVKDLTMFLIGAVLAPMAKMYEGLDNL